MAAHSSTLAWKIPWTGACPWGRKESDTTEWHQFHFPHLLLFSVYKRNWHSDPDKTIRGGTSLPSSRTPSFPIKLYSLLQQKKKKGIQFSSVTQSCPILCDPMNRSIPGLPVHHQLPESTQNHVHWVGDAIQPSHPLSFPSPPALNRSQHQGLFKWVSSSHQVAKVLELQLQNQSYQWIPRSDLL